MEPAGFKASAAPLLSAAAISALQRGDKIAAIKTVRAERHIGLKEAKDAVDEYVQSHPALQSAFAAAQAESKRTALTWLVMIAALAIVAFYFLARR